MGAIALFDWIVIVVYLLGITGLGLWASKKVHSSTSLFIGDRQFGKWMMTFHSFGTGTHSDQAVGVAAKAYTTGASGIWYQWLWLFVTPFYWLIAPIFRRMRAVTVGEYFEVRYGSSVAVLFAAVRITLWTTLRRWVRGPRTGSLRSNRAPPGSNWRRAGHPRR